MWALCQDEVRNPSQLWGHTDDDDVPLAAPPRTLQALATPKKRSLGQRGTAQQYDSDHKLEAAGFGTSSSSGKAPSREENSPKFRVNKADQGNLLDLHSGQAKTESNMEYTGFKAESGDLRSLRQVKGHPGADPLSEHYGGHLKFRNTKSFSMSVASTPDALSPDAESVSGESWAKRPKDAAYAALRYLGLLPNSSKHPPAKSAQVRTSSVVGHLLEFALSVCFATAAECRALAEAAGEEDKKALLRLRALAERTNLLGRGVVVSSVNDATLSPAELVFAFLEASANSRRHTYGRHHSASSMMSSAGRSFSRVKFDDSPPDENRSLNGDSRHHTPPRQETDQVVQGQYLNNLPRQDSLASNQSGMSFLNKRTGFGRSQSDFSYSSFADFNRKHEAGDEKNARTVTETSVPDAPAFVEFLIVILKGQESSAEPLPLGSKGGSGNLVLDLKLNHDFIKADHTDDDAASALTYHSYCDALLGSEGAEEKETISAEIARMEGAEGKQTIRVTFNSKCLRTHNRWQAHLLAQQRALLDMVTGKLKAVEKTLKADEEVQEEERELLRGFRKIVRREQGPDDVQAPVEVFVVEQHPKLRAEAEELCRILSYPCKRFSSFSQATQAVAEASQGTIQRVVSMISQKSVKSNPASTLPDLLENRPGSTFGDWRCRAVCTTGRSAGNVMLETPTQIVLLGMAWMSRGQQLPPEWQQQGVSVVLITEAGDFHEVGRQLEASGEGEIREKLREKGICDYLLHPLSLEGLSAVISNAEERRLEEYLLLDILGRGATACVHKAKRLRDNETVALKEINMRRLSRVAKEEIDRELRLLRELSWPSIVFTLDAWENEKEKLRYVVMPLLEGGSLSHRIETAREGAEEEGYSVDRVADWFVQTLHGLSYLHWRGVIHRDIKPGNLLIGQDNRLLQIGDLGSAMLLPGTGPFPNPHAKVVAPVTSPSYASPEALLQETHLAASDVWCVGASFFEVLALHPLFPQVQSMAEAQEHVRAFDPSMAAPTNGATNYALAALSTLNQLRCSSSSSAAAVELAGALPELVRPDFMQRPTAATVASRYFCMKRVKTLLKETGAVPKGMLSGHIEDYKTVLKQSQAAKNTAPDAAGVSPVDSPVARGRGPRPRREML